MKKKTITLRKRQLEKIKYLKERLGADTYSGVVVDAVEVTDKVLLSLEEEWRGLCDKYGQFVPLEPTLKMIEDYVIHLSFVARRKERPLGSEFLFEFGRKLAEKLGRPEEAEEMGRRVNDDYWSKSSCRQE